MIDEMGYRLAGPARVEMGLGGDVLRLQETVEHDLTSGEVSVRVFWQRNLIRNMIRGCDEINSNILP